MPGEGEGIQYPRALEINRGVTAHCTVRFRTLMAAAPYPISATAAMIRAMSCGRDRR
jgi:hypothetical protein